MPRPGPVDGERPGAPSRWHPLVLIPLVLSAWVYYPITLVNFFADDFAHLASIESDGLRWTLLCLAPAREEAAEVGAVEPDTVPPRRRSGSSIGSGAPTTHEDRGRALRRQGVATWEIAPRDGTPRIVALGAESAPAPRR